MAASFVLPLLPLEETVLLPGETLAAPRGTAWVKDLLGHARAWGGAVVTSLVDGDSVHEVGVTAIVGLENEEQPSLRGISRCRLLGLVGESLPLVRAQRFPDGVVTAERAAALARLLTARYVRLCERRSRPCDIARHGRDLGSITWQVTAGLGLSAEQQQGFLNVPDPVTRGRLLLVFLRELERRERFLRPWSHLRPETSWN